MIFNFSAIRGVGNGGFVTFRGRGRDIAGSTFLCTCFGIVVGFVFSGGIRLVGGGVFLRSGDGCIRSNRLTCSGNGAEVGTGILINGIAGHADEVCIKAGSVGDGRAIGNDEHALSQGRGLGTVGEEDDACAAGTKKFAGLGEVLKGGCIFGLDGEIADDNQICAVDQCAEDLELQEVSGTDITCNSIEINAKSRGPSADFTRIDDLSHCGAGNNKVLGQRQGGN